MDPELEDRPRQGIRAAGVWPGSSAIVSQACKMMGYSRRQFLSRKELLQRRRQLALAGADAAQARS